AILGLDEMGDLDLPERQRRGRLDGLPATAEVAAERRPLLRRELLQPAEQLAPAAVGELDPPAIRGRKQRRAGQPPRQIQAGAVPAAARRGTAAAIATPGRTGGGWRRSDRRGPPWDAAMARGRSASRAARMRSAAAADRPWRAISGDPPGRCHAPPRSCAPG